MDLTIHNIRKSLGRSQSFARQSRESGDTLDINIMTMMDLNTTATYIQILFLIIYGIAWVLIVKGLKKWYLRTKIFEM